jgi:hypothetical protein
MRTSLGMRVHINYGTDIRKGGKETGLRVSQWERFAYCSFLKTGTTSSSESWVRFYQTARRSIPDDSCISV